MAAIKFGAGIFIQSGVIDIFPNLKMAPAAILDLFGWATGPPMKHHSWYVPPVKFRHDRLNSCQVIRIVIFCRSGLKVLFVPQTIQFWGTSFRPPKGTSLHGTTSFEPSLVQAWRTVRPVALAKKTKIEKKKQWQTSYSPRPPTSPYRSQSLHVGWPPVCSSIVQVLLKSVQWFCRYGWSKIDRPAIGLYTSLYYRTSRDVSRDVRVTCNMSVQVALLL